MIPSLPWGSTRSGPFTLSFDALRELATVAGLNRSIAWLWPLIVDGFILLATAAAVALRDRGPRVTWYPWATLIVFAAISVAGNALHASSHADREAVSVTVASVVSAVPAVALLLASHLMVVLLSPSATPASWSDGSDSARRAAKDANTTAARARPAQWLRPTVEWQARRLRWTRTRTNASG